MAFTSHLHHLRINGKPRTKHSVKHRPTKGERAVEVDDCQRTDWVEGVVVDVHPHEIAKVFKTIYGTDGTPAARQTNASKNHPRKKMMPASWYYKVMHHYSPQARVWAANGLGYLGKEAIPYIAQALKSKDGRLRVAGLNAISCATGWGPGKTRSKISSDMIKANFLPTIVKTLRDKSVPMWEHRHALMAMSCADNASIEANFEIIKPYFFENEWWLRVAAFKSIEPLIKDAKAMRALMPAMMASYDEDVNLPARRWGATSVFKAAIAANPEIKDELVAAMAKSVNKIELREGFHQPIDLNNIFETLRYINMKKNPEHAIPLLPAIERIYPNMPPLPATWTIIGARWGNIGLAKAAVRLKKDGRPFIATMKRIYPNLASRNKKGKQGESLIKAQAILEKTVKEWEAVYGKVKVD